MDAPERPKCKLVRQFPMRSRKFVPDIVGFLMYTNLDHINTFRRCYTDPKNTIYRTRRESMRTCVATVPVRSYHTSLGNFSCVAA